MKNKDVKKWVAALRSGNYEQCQNTLHSQRGGFCCLGVAMDVLLDGDWVPSTDGSYHFNPEGMRIPKRSVKSSEFRPSGMPLDRQREELGLSEGTADQLANMNDQGISFKKIASFIERLNKKRKNGEPL